MSDDLLLDVARRAFAPIVKETPPLPEWDDLESVAGPSRLNRSWKPLMVATATAFGATAVVLVAVLIARGSPVSDVAEPSQPSATTTPSTTTASNTAPVVLPLEGNTVIAQLGPDPGLDTAEPLTASLADSPFVELVKPSDLTRPTVVMLNRAAVELLESVDATSPYTVEVAFRRLGNTYAVVSYGDSSRGLIVVGDDPYESWSQEDSWVDVRYTRRGDTEPWVELMWFGVPDGASHVTVTSPEYADNAPQRVTASSAFIAMPKPFWTQYVTLEAIAPDGGTLASREVLVDGSTCSAGKHNPQAVPNEDLPAVVDTARRDLFAEIVGCRYSVIEMTAIGSDGPFFGAGTDSLAQTLRETDRRSDIMRSMRNALLLGAKEDSRKGETVFVFQSESVEIVLDSNGRWVSAKLTE